MAFVPLRTVVGTDEEDTGFKPLRDVYLGPAPQRNALAAGLSSGVDQLQGLGYSIVGGAADLAGATTARDWANEQARRNQIDASLAGRPDLENIEDQTLGSALPYMGYQIAKQVPLMAGITAAQFVPGAGQVAGALGLTRLGALAPRALGGAGLEAGASIAARRAALAQGEALATGTMAGSALGFGSMYGESVEGGDPSAWKALALSPIYGAAEAVLPAVLQGGLRLPSRYSGNLATRMAKAGGVAGSGEALTELGQNELEMGMRSDLTDEEKASRRLNSAAAGFLVGGGLGSVGGFKGQATGLDTRQIDLLSGEQDIEAPPNKPLQLGFSPLAGTPIIFPDGSVALNGEQEMLARTGIKLPAAQETDLTVPATTAADTTANTTAAVADTATTKTVVPSIFSAVDEELNALNIRPTKKSRNIYEYMKAKDIDPTSEEAQPIIDALAQSKYKFATDTIGAIIRARSPRGTGVSTVQQPAGSVGVGSAIVPGTVGAAGSDATVQGGVVGSPAPAGAAPQQTSVLPSATGQSATVVDQGPTTRGAPGTTALVDTSDDALEIARATGNAAEIEAMRQDQEGGRADQIDFGNSEMEAVIDERFSKSKNKERDRKILQAYILARKSVPEGYKGNIAQEIADTFDVDASRVRQIGNPELLANIAEGMGFDREQVFTHLGVDSATKAATTELGKLESDLAKLEAKVSPSKADIAKMSELSEKIDQVKGSIESGDLTSALKELGVEGEAGEMFASLDDSRDWQKASTAGSQIAVKLVGIADKIAELKAAAAELKQLGLTQAEAAATERVNALAADYETLTTNIIAAKQEPKQSKAQKKTEAAQKAAEENDVAKEAARQAEAAKFREERAAKLAADRKGLEVGDTVVNPKLGTGVVKGFSGDGDATIVTVDFQSGQTKELSVKMAKLEKTNAVQVQSTAVVPVQSEAQTGQGVGGQVRSTEKPTSQGQTQGQAKGQVANKGQALWDSLVAKTPGLVPYDQLTKLEQDYLTDLAVRTNGKPVVAKEMGLQQLLTKEPVTIDVEARVIDEQVTQQVAALPAPQIDRLEKHYGAKRDTAEFLEKVQADITKYVTQGAEAVAGAIRSIIKAMAEGVLAMGIVFNPNITKDAFNINVGKTFQQTIEVTQEVPEAAKARMSPTAQAVYSAMAPVAMKSGKWFMVADKPNGMLHIFKEDGSHALSDATLYGKDKGDVLGAVSSLEGGPKITPAGKFTMKESPADYAGGTSLILMESKDYTGYIAVHAADTSTPSENRLGRLASATAEDNRISYGCINTKHDTFINEIKPNISKLDGGMMFILPEAEDQAAKMFAAETRTETRTEGGQGAKGRTAATVVGKEENMLFGKDGKAKKPYTAKQLLAELKDFIRADISGRKLMVVDTIDDLLNDPDPNVREVGAAIKKENAYGVALDGRAYLIADRVNRGSGRAKFMHEVGAHLGLENLLSKQTYNKLVQQLKTWAQKKDGSIESVLAQRATKRFESAGTTEAQQDNELLAYFLEEAIDAGVDPTAASKESGPLVDWFRTLWAAFKIAVRKLGLKPETLNAQDVVNLAFGAARLEINGTWHGTAAAFRKFNHDFMGTGEGAQAYGWGSYFAQSVGIAKGYWSADIRRKRKATGEAPEGSLMRVDIPIADEDVLDWDQPLSKQPAILAKIQASISNILREDVEDQVGADLADMTGDEFYRGLGFVEVRTGAVSEEFDVDDYNKRLRNAGFKEIVSKYLDEKLGIPALRFLDQNSRGDKYQSQIKLKQLQEILREKEAAVEKASKEAAKWEALQDKAPPEQRDYARKTWLNTVAARTTAEFQAEEIRQEVESLKQKIIGLDNPTRNVVVFNDKNIFRAGSATAADKQRMKFGKNAPTAGVVQQNISQLPKAAQQPVRNSINRLNDWYRQGLDRLVFTSDLINRAVDAGLKTASQFQSLLAKRSTRARELERQVERVADMYALVEDKFKGSGPDSVNEFIFQSTRTGKWGYGQYRNAEMGEKFDAFGEGSKAQEFIKAVFAHGATMLAAKKKAVTDYTASEYDARIAAETDPAKKAALVKEKAADLKDFARLFSIREGIPYAPIKRFGNHVVIAKSAEYLAAADAKDTKLLRKLEQDPDHYHVSFTETKNEARNLSEQLIDQGHFSSGKVLFKERSEFDRELFGNVDSLAAITRLRSMADAKADGGDKDAAAMKRMVSDLYLQALAESSARKSEMRRRGVSGELDMLRSFAAQGRADANFVASVQYNPQIQDAIQAMRKEENTGAGNVNRKSELLNEITRRYDSSLQTEPSPTIGKITRLSSIYYLATSPAYYLQNLTQPWMMSVPAMAGRHDYLKASAALTQAYSQLGGVMKSAKLFDQQFDFGKVPSDVRAAIQELANRGAIDIGMETELGEFKIEGDSAFTKGWNKVDKGLRIAVQKVESINRLSTAMAAYRLELAKNGSKENAINYAERILTETHGDYSAFNAPRVFNTQLGKIALQFRKFQLIQLSFYAKLLKDAGFSTEEKRAATKTLAYALGHTGMLAGVMGLPGYAAISWALGALFGDDDDPLDVTAELRKFIGDEDMANLIMRGAPTIAGMDISGKVGAGNMLSIMPFSQADLTTRAGVIEAAGTLIGGAPVGMAARVADGLGLMLDGNWYRGLEQVLPKGLGDAVKAYRIADQGTTRRNGDILLPASEISAVDTAMQAIGIQPVKQSVVMERQQATVEMNQRFQDRSTKIKADYVRAIRAGESTEEARTAWMKLQEARVNNGYTRQPLSELLRAPQSQTKRERQTIDGVQFNRTNKRFVEEQV